MRATFRWRKRPSFAGFVAGETEDVIGGRVFLHLREDAAEVIGVEEGFAAGIVGERRKRFLRIRVAVEIVEDRVAVIRGLAVQAGVLRFPARRKRLQAANVEWINRDVCFHRGRRCGAQRGLIVDTGLRDPVAEIDDRFFLRDFPERLHDRLQREQLSIGGEGVVVRIVWRERAAGFSRTFGRAFGASIVSLALAGAVRAQRRQNFFLIVGEIEIDVHVRRKRDERDHVGRKHFFFDELRCRIHAAIDLLRIHAGKIEEQKDEPAVARIDLNRIRGVQQTGIRRVARNAIHGGFGSTRRGERVHVFEIKSRDVLLLAVFGEREVFAFQIADQVAVFVARDDVDQHEFRRDAHAILRLLRRLRRVLRERYAHRVELHQYDGRPRRAIF